MADSTNTATNLIEEGNLRSESLRLESEPWTIFYRAGEVIRESRKASGKQSKYASEGNRTHSENAIDRYDHPCDVGSLAKGDPNVGTDLDDRPECDGVRELQTMNINSETQVIKETEFKTFGGGSAIASSSLATEWVKGKTSRKRWPSRTRISSANSAFSRATLLHATRYSRTGGRLYLAGSPIF
jgi:NifU-like N terminal domain